MLPGRDAAGAAVCVDCAGIALDLHCHRCGHEEERYRAMLCARCALREDLLAMLRPTDAQDPRHGLVEALSSAARPQSVLTWMRGRQAAALLQALGTGEVELSHDGLDLLPPGRPVEHLRRWRCTTDSWPNEIRTLPDSSGGSAPPSAAATGNSATHP
ncbi:hypothetical protein RAJCM14343_1996 [Rhodococcus aetherivorans]|uniref:Uncharacterized protein n=2 Tax=Rhodococcus aetherivorans TaxID=191292 RepID=A0ABQ0YJT0_9NOCA|nr:hypothetical protein RAJCM14343_1996 [Rhodococcus aetherivorans]